MTGTTHASSGVQTEVAEAYVERLVAGAAAVSSVFQEKLRRALGGVGRQPDQEIDKSGWRPVDEVATTLSEIESVAGSDVLRTTGAQMVGEDCVETTDPEAALAALDERTAEQIHRGPGADRVGSCRARRVGRRELRVAVDEGYRYPLAFAEGVFRATTALAADVSRSAVELDPTATATDERHAVVVSW